MQTITYSIGIPQSVFAIGRLENGVISLLGTGFSVSRDKIATAAHVTGGIEKGLVCCTANLSSLDQYQDTDSYKVLNFSVKIYAFDPIKDVCILIVEGLSLNFPYVLSSTDEARPGTEINSLGYPHADQGRLVLTQHKSFVGARVLISSFGAKSKQIVMNTQTRPGQSGSPVFSSSDSKVYAMILGGHTPKGGGIIIGNINPETLNQTTYAISAEYISGMLK